MLETASVLPKLLLLGGVVGPLLFVLVIWLEGALRPGYDLLRHFGSELALGKRGWIQITNFLLAGVLVTASAFGVAQVLPGSFWASVFLGAFGLSLLIAGGFVTDPVFYFPPEVIEKGPTRHGTIHKANFPFCFGSLMIATFVFAGLFFTRPGWLGWALYSLLTGLAFLVFSVLMIIAAGQTSATGRREVYVGLWQRCAITTGWLWIALLNGFLLWHACFHTHSLVWDGYQSVIK
jgi:hypothetical protein